MPQYTDSIPVNSNSVSDKQFPIVPWQAGIILNLALSLNDDALSSLQTIMEYQQCDTEKKLDTKATELAQTLKEEDHLLNKDHSLDYYIDQKTLWGKYLQLDKEYNIFDRYFGDFIFGVDWLINHGKETIKALQTGFKVQRNLYTVFYLSNSGGDQGLAYYFSVEKPEEGEEYRYSRYYQASTLPVSPLDSKATFTKEEILEHLDRFLYDPEDYMVVEPLSVPAASLDSRHEKIAPLEVHKREARHMIRRLRFLVKDGDYNIPIINEEKIFYLVGFMHNLINKSDLWTNPKETRAILNKIFKNVTPYGIKSHFTATNNKDLTYQVGKFLLSKPDGYYNVDTEKAGLALFNYLKNKYDFDKTVKVIRHPKDKEKKTIYKELEDWLQEGENEDNE